MPKQRQIQFLTPALLADGTLVWHWKPSPRLRAAAFVNQRLGTGGTPAKVLKYSKAPKHIADLAIELNERVDAWEKNQAKAANDAPARPLPRVVRFGELVLRYMASDAYTTNRDSTQREYKSRLKALTHWALDGELPVRDIDAELVRALRNELVKGSAHKAAAMMRVLHLLLEWAEAEGIIPKNSNPASRADVPVPPARKVTMPTAARAAIAEAAAELGEIWLALAIDLGFWIVQRQADIRHFNRFAWRELHDVEPRDRAVLANAQGRVFGFRLCQQKTGTWVDAPVPPALHATIDAHWRDSTSEWLFPKPEKPDEPLHEKTFQRRFAAARAAAWAVAIMRDQPDLADAIERCQFRDLRRTGMMFYRDCGAKMPWITALSGHMILGKKTILDTYMPGDTAAACACVAAGVAHLEAQREREEQA
jgi:hypothetical protein